MPKLHIRNSTVYPDAEVRRLIRFALAELDFRYGDLAINVVHTRISGWRTTPYPATGEAFLYEMDLRVSRPRYFPCPWNDRRFTGVKVGMIETWQEALVAIAAHEGKHVAESQAGRVPDHRTREARSDAYAASRLAAYRG